MTFKKAPLAALALVLLPAISGAALKPEKVHATDGRKTEAYIKDGLFVGGDRAIDEVIVRDIRRAANPSYERVVIDLEGAKNGESAAIPRPPYYHVAVTPDEKRLVFTLWGHPKLGFDSKKVTNAFKKSGVVSHVELLPRMDDDSWTFVIGLKSEKPVEVFELSNPVRIIVDIKGPIAAAAAPKATHAKTARKTKKSRAPSLPTEKRGEGSRSGSGADAPPETGITPDASEREHEGQPE